MNKHILALVYLLSSAPALATDMLIKKTEGARRRASACQTQAPQRNTWPNGTRLWGTTRKVADQETSSVLASLDLSRVSLGSAALKGVRIEDGRLVAPALVNERFAGAMLQGTASDGQPVEVALCAVETDADDPSLVWYRIQVWNAESATWANPCTATNRVPAPRALAVPGIWDETGARRDLPGKFTFACENGAIAKCIDWGYKPWATKEGRSLQDLHQACTRMVRADYCGDGRSHTQEENPIDMYDEFKLLTRTTQASRSWDPTKASFEAAWTPEGASCLARTRDGQAIETILAQCPERFEPGTKDLDGGDRCTVLRKGGSDEPALLRNHTYGKAPQVGSSTWGR
ncbi:ADYC domain-containing protein [Pyxidicoccus sp. MSG2]|uniref:ADYC domain-containing protein n=1 Tax=Pyxidicoccus sp. MSG2 TaxID=2996790 RepID=UPI002270F5B0|nr:ADYC domain-containing protein [Pyxidicoccus sp. MSG2]MCY1015907.1 ADYC domain-containing protein [Pyxidicoccus sp. MSG2]